ncbi:MAG: hypothetical protein WCJ30_04225 [Deltaproteobacteria bacterium]
MSTERSTDTETIDDADLERALDEADAEAGDDADEVLGAIDEMVRAISRAVA